MKPSRLLHILAYSVELASAAGVLGAWAFGLCFAAGGAPPVMEWSYLAGVLLLVVLSIPGGAIIGVIVLLPFLQVAARKVNGAPFKRGDKVQILRGPFRGKVTHVYEIWETRNQLRLVLGDEQKATAKDVFDVQEVCRVE